MSPSSRQQLHSEEQKAQLNMHIVTPKVDCTKHTGLGMTSASNFIADRVAAGDYASLFEYNQLEIIETTTFDIITELASIQT